MAIYAKLASTLRHRIARGEWKVGDKLPTVEAFAREMDVSRITVRQAYAVLAAEGLIDSRRGRGTHVRGLPPSRDDGLRSAINSEEIDTPDLQITILDCQRDVPLPARFLDRKQSRVLYVRLRKLHVHRGLPFCYADMFVQQRVFDRFPEGAQHTSKINRLIRQVAPAKADLLRQRITVEQASEEVADLLRYEVAAPLAVVQRMLRSKSGEVLSAGDFFYRSDQFVLESEVPASLTVMYPSLSIPESRTR